MIPKKFAAIVAIGALAVSSTACQGGPKATEFAPDALKKLVAKAGTASAIDVDVATTAEGESPMVSASFADGQGYRTIGVSKLNPEPHQIAVGTDSFDAGAAFDVNTVDMAALARQAQDYAKVKCGKDVGVAKLEALTAKARKQVLSCVGTGGSSTAEVTIDGKAILPPDPDKPAELVKQFYDLVNNYGGETTSGINIERRTDGFNMSWLADRDKPSKNMVGAACQPSLGWRSESGSTSSGNFISNGCQPAAGASNAAVPMAQLDPAGLTKIIQASGTTYFIGLQVRDGKPIWSVQPSNGLGASTYYDAAGNKLPA